MAAETVLAPHLLGKATSCLYVDAGQQHGCGIHSAVCQGLASTSDRSRDACGEPGEQSRRVSGQVVWLATLSLHSPFLSFDWCAYRALPCCRQQMSVYISMNMTYIGRAQRMRTC